MAAAPRPARDHPDPPGAARQGADRPSTDPPDPDRHDPDPQGVARQSPTRQRAAQPDAGVDGSGRPSADTSGRPPRADALRNRTKLLEAARELFAERGVGASLDEIARRAGVGSGTLYRHFPTRDRLVLALMADGLEGLCELAPALAAEHPPTEALTRWLRAYARHASDFQGLAATLVERELDDSDPSADVCHRAQDAGHALVAAAVEHGNADPDVDPRDVLDLAVSAAWVTEQGPRSLDQIDRLVNLVVRGLTSRP